MQRYHDIRDGHRSVAEEMGKLAEAHADGQPWSDDDEARWHALDRKATAHEADRRRLCQDATEDAAAPDGRLSDGRPLHEVMGPRTSARSTAQNRAEDPTTTRALADDESAVEYLRTRVAGSAFTTDSRLSRLRIGTALRAFLTGPRDDTERRALSEGTDSAGGYTVPTLLSGQIIDRLRPMSHVMSAGAKIVPLASDAVTFAKIASDPTATWRAENAAVSESDSTFGGLTFTPSTLAVVVRASRELIEDSVNVEEALEHSLATAFSSELDRVALVGSGTSNEPTGIRNTTGVTQVSMGTNGAAITDFSEMLDLLRDLRAANAPGTGAAIMAPRTLRTIDGFADTTGQPLRLPPALAATDFRATSQVPTDETQGTSSAASSVFFGDWSQVWIGVRTSFRLQTLQERYADNLQLGFLAYLRADIAIAQPAAMGRLIGITA